MRRALGLLNKLTGMEVSTKKFDLRMKSMDAEISAIQNFIKEDPEKPKVITEEKKDVGYIG